MMKTLYNNCMCVVNALLDLLSSKRFHCDAISFELRSLMGFFVIRRPTLCGILNRINGSKHAVEFLIMRRGAFLRYLFVVFRAVLAVFFQSEDSELRIRTWIVSLFYVTFLILMLFAVTY